MRRGAIFALLHPDHIVRNPTKQSTLTLDDLEYFMPIYMHRNFSGRLLDIPAVMKERPTIAGTDAIDLGIQLVVNAIRSEALSTKSGLDKRKRQFNWVKVRRVGRQELEFHPSRARQSIRQGLNHTRAIPT